MEIFVWSSNRLKSLSSEDPDVRDMLDYYLKDRRKIKFVLVGNERLKSLAIFSPNESHSHIAYILIREGFKFIGAGRWERGYVYWDSSTCLSYFGYDRPSEMELANTLIEEIKESLRPITK